VNGLNKLVYPDTGILFKAEKKEPIKPWKNMAETQIHSVR
jgi:hypothetical protein